MYRIAKTCLALAACLLTPLLAEADVLKLSSGGQIEGSILNPKQSPRLSYVVKTDAGQITLPSASVKEVIEKTQAEKDYEANLPQMKNTLEDHLKMADWCKANRLEDKRVLHLQEVIQLDPENQKARGDLGYTKFRGKWIIREEWMKQQGYIRFRGQWMFSEDVATLQRLEKFKDQQIEWRKKLKTWQSQLRRGGERAALAQKEIAKINDFAAAQVLIDLCREESNEKMKLLLIQAMANIKTNQVTAELAKYAAHDGFASVRDQATIALEQRQNQVAVSYLVKNLRSDENWRINQCATVLGRLKSPASIVPLMDALVTYHKKQVVPGAPPGQTSATFGSGGGGGMKFGTPKTKIVSIPYQNQGVLNALLQIVGDENVNFLFNEANWKLWYATKKIPLDIDLRRND